MIEEALLRSFSLPTPIHCTQCAGGANNRVFRLEFSEREPLILKRYFQHPQDTRQRLDTEFSFLTYAWNTGIRCIPEPIACSRQENAALYSFCPGKPLSEAARSHVEQAIQFYFALNRCKDDGRHLPLSSEACFFLQEHLQLVETRLDRLRACTETMLADFLQTSLLPAWETIKLSLAASNDTPLALEDRCISPSDFGFHNALMQEDGKLCFIDFEYAGWDDPSKMVCDFFCQPRVPVPRQWFSEVASQFFSQSRDPQMLAQRAEHLLPLYHIKWCCILLNCFSPVGKNRRTFALSDEQKEVQIQKANQQLEALAWLI